MNSTVEKQKNSLITDTLVIAALPALGYLISFCYEYGYCSYFNLPEAFISPSLATVLIATTAIVFVGLSAINPLNLLTPLFRASSSEKLAAYRVFFRLNSFMLASAVVVLVIFKFSLSFVIWSVVIILAIDTLYFGIPLLLSWKDKRPFQEKFQSISNSDNKFNLAQLFMDKYGSRPVGVVIALVTVNVLAGLIGYATAKYQTDFFVLQSRQDYVLLRYYGDSVIFAKCDTTTKTIGEELMIINRPSVQQIDLVEKKIGPLRKLVLRPAFAARDGKTVLPDSGVGIEQSGDKTRALPNTRKKDARH